MNTDIYQKLIQVLNDSLEPLPEQSDNYLSLIDKIADARFVMLGEATNGTKEFYQTRIEMTKQLIEKKAFMAVAIEGDWPDSYTIHRYIQGKNKPTDCIQALEDFKRFPAWMWRNTTIPPFLRWLREYNDRLGPGAQKIGFYGLDLYSLNASMQAVISYLMQIDPEAAQHARKHYACFDHLNVDPQMYGYLTNIGIKKSCLNDAIAVLLEIQHHAFEYAHQNSLSAEEDYFFAAQNARLVKDAEVYYRAMFEGRASSWNVRDTHMMDTLNNLAAHLESRFKKPAKIVIWSHNSHLGDARATEMSEQGEINIGQLVREQYTNHSYSIGFSTYEGFVTAATDWDSPAERKKIMPGLVGSYEELFHHLKYKNFILDLLANKKLDHYLQLPRLQRAIGVIYRPESERLSHYFFTHLPYQFDCIIHFDHSTAIQPLEPNVEWK